MGKRGPEMMSCTSASPRVGASQRSWERGSYPCADWMPTARDSATLTAAFARDLMLSRGYFCRRLENGKLSNCSSWLLSFLTRSCHYLTLGWTFSYLLFFRTVAYFGFPDPTPFSNAIQLLLTLKMVSLANEVQEFTQAKKQDVASFTKSSMIGVIPKMPGLVEILCYSYCYVGLMTGPFYRYRTHYDWLTQPDSSAIPSWPLLLSRSKTIPIFGASFLLVSHFFPLDYVRSSAFYERGLPFRLFYMMPVFFVFRMRFYVAWLCAECACIAAAFGAYPAAAKSRSGGGPTVEYEPLSRSADGEALSLTYDYETIKNIDPHGTDFCVKVKDGMRYWNMTVQWWLAQYIYKSAPFRSYVLRNIATTSERLAMKPTGEVMCWELFGWQMVSLCVKKFLGMLERRLGNAPQSSAYNINSTSYYLSFLTIPLCLAAEGAMERGFLKHLTPAGRLYGDWVQWFLKMRAYDYMCMGFVLLTFEDTVRYWSAIYYCVHVGAVAFFLLGKLLGSRRDQGGSPRSKEGAAQIPQWRE
ncbi:lysophospholipid acyltransferase 7 [Sphaerodactylus townsendi]|uniref:lysophospholipid acyltransferase 7 n=1 Tax=Sphaerodactylus townsendi TaxID=933632 RepID=UPI002025BEB4|nr:lysophospholipid acyltransferase 7 [Sphaerodactylus townsendi]